MKSKAFYNSEQAASADRGLTPVRKPMQYVKTALSRPLLSKALIAEDFRRYWIIVAAAAAICFLTTVFPILMSYKTLERDMVNFIGRLLQNQNPAILFFNALLPVITATVLYRYMHSSGSTAVVHAMPFTRSTLFNSHLVSGFCMSAAPILFSGISLLLISKPVMVDPAQNAYDIAMDAMIWMGPGHADSGARTAELVNVFARGEILAWMWQSLLMIAVIYMIAAFTACVTGNAVMHFMISGIMIGLTPALLMTATLYFQRFLYGYTLSQGYSELVMSINPLMQGMIPGSSLSAGRIAWYIISIAVLYCLGIYLYMTKKLERASESITFRPFAVYLSCVASFFGMTAFGFYFDYLSGSSGLVMYLGFATGTVLIFLIAELIISRSWNIFNKKVFARLGAYALLSVLFLTSLQLDITGYERRIPADAGQVESVYLDNAFYNQILTADRGSTARGRRIELKTAANIEAVLRLHQSLLEQRPQPAEEGRYARGQTESCYFEYKLKNGAYLARQYSGLTVREFLVGNADMKTIMESEEFKKQMLWNNLQLKGTGEPDAESSRRQIHRIHLSSMHDTGQQGISLSAEAELKGFYESFQKDLMARSYEEQLLSCAPFISLDIELQRQYEINASYISDTYNIELDASFRHSIAWLREKGFYDQLVLKPEQVAYITIDKYEYDENGYPSYTGDPGRDEQIAWEKAIQSAEWESISSSAEKIEETVYSETPPVSTSRKLVITDKAQIQKVLETYHSYNAWAGGQLSAYTVAIFYQKEDAANGVQQIRRDLGHYYENTVPAEIAAYFK